MLFPYGTTYAHTTLTHWILCPLSPYRICHDFIQVSTSRIFSHIIYFQIYGTTFFQIRQIFSVRFFSITTRWKSRTLNFTSQNVQNKISKYPSTTFIIVPNFFILEYHVTKTQCSLCINGCINIYQRSLQFMNKLLGGNTQT